MCERHKGVRDDLQGERAPRKVEIKDGRVGARLRERRGREGEGTRRGYAGERLLRLGWQLDGWGLGLE